MKPTRRKFAAIGIGTILGTGTVVSIGTDTTAAEVTGSFTLPDVERDVQNPVDSVRMDASGSVSWDSETKPTRVILRLEVAKNSTDYEQVEAKTFLPALSGFKSNLLRSHKPTYSTIRKSLLWISRQHRPAKQSNSPYTQD